MIQIFKKMESVTANLFILVSVILDHTRLVPDFGGQFYPIFGQVEDDFLLWTLDDFLKKSFNQFYILLCVQILNQLFCLWFKLLLDYLLIKTFKKIQRTHSVIFRRNYQLLPFQTVKMPTMAVQNSQTLNKRPLFSFENIASMKNFL